MADPQTVIEGTLKYRDNKKWKPRWCVIRKLSPVADCLHLQLYRDSKDRCKNGPTKASLSLEGFLGLETGFTLDKESNTMALICTEVVVVLAFDSRELLIQWQVKVRANLLEEHQFLVQIAFVPPKSKLSSGPARLHLLDYMFCLTAGVPPRLLGIWPLRELRRFGVVDGKFCFEGGSRCGKGEGLHVLLTNQAKDLVQAFDMASRGRLPGKRKVSVRKNTNGGAEGPPRPGSRPCSAAEGATESGGEGGKRPCHFHYRWPSCIVPCRTEGAAPPEEGAKTIARSTVGGGTKDMMWAVGHCQGCGVHYCRRGGHAEDDPSGFTPQWTMDLVSPEGGPRGGGNRRKAHDRSSLCSQSSQSSGTSTASSSSGGSEYSVPKNCLEAFYDRPKNIHHPSNRLSLTEEGKDRLLPIREGGCGCWKRADEQLQLLCSCSSSGSSNASPSTSPKKQLLPILLPCTCGKVNPYLNYAVPRSGAPTVKGAKEEPTEKTEATISGTSQGTSQETKIINKVDNNIPSEEKENNNVGTPKAIPPTIPAPSSYYQQPAVCSCQRLLLCPSSFLPPAFSNNNQQQQQQNDRKLAGRNSSEYGSLNKTAAVVAGDDKKRTDHNLNNCRCRQDGGGGGWTTRVVRRDNANHIYVNLKYLQETAAMGVPGKLIPYYANLHFLQTLSLYENAEVLDVRPPGSGTVPEGPSATEKPPRPRRKVDTPSSNNGVYEMMSFNQSEFQSPSGGNYLLMQPGTTSESLEPCGGSSSSGDSMVASTSTTCSETTPEGTPESLLPLRPFMPVLLPFHEHTCDQQHPECKSSRSNSLGDIKVSVFRRGRSSSTDGDSSSSPKSTPRKHPLLTKLTLRSKEKSFSTDDVTPPSSAPSSPDSLFLENIQKYPFHRSADCLQMTEEYRLSEEDLSQDPETIMSQSMVEKTRSAANSIKRSSSVPCKQQAHPADSSGGTQGGRDPQGAVFSHFIAYHGSLPRRHSGNAASRHMVGERKAAGKQQEVKSSDQSKMILISECKQCHQLVTSPDGVLVLDAKSMTSSSSSDMSDYIESLSLCSSGSSEDQLPNSKTCTLRPRSGKEYHALFQQQQQQQQQQQEDNNNKINSPSPGYASQASSPTFAFKELNYLEVVSVAGGESTTGGVQQQQQQGVQYAVIDVVATSAARRVGSERAQLRGPEGKVEEGGEKK